MAGFLHMRCSQLSDQQSLVAKSYPHCYGVGRSSEMGIHLWIGNGIEVHTGRFYYVGSIICRWTMEFINDIH